MEGTDQRIVFRNSHKHQFTEVQHQIRLVTSAQERLNYSIYRQKTKNRPTKPAEENSFLDIHTTEKGKFSTFVLVRVIFHANKLNLTLRLCVSDTLDQRFEFHYDYMIKAYHNKFKCITCTSTKAHDSAR